MHKKCRRLLFGNSSVSIELPYSREHVVEEVRRKALRMSLSGAQPKASVRIIDKALEVVGLSGDYILKPSTDLHPEISENEHFAMNAVKAFGLPIPPLCLVLFKDGERALLLRRFDRFKKEKLHVEDLASVLEKPASEKYNGSYAEVLNRVATHCRDSGLEKLRLFQLIVLSYVLGNNDLHLKNFSILDTGSYYQLSPVYDVVCSSLYYPSAPMVALDLLPEYEGGLATFGYYRCDDFLQLAKAGGIDQTQAHRCFARLQRFKPKLLALLEASFLSLNYKKAIQQSVEDNFKRLFAV